MAETISKVKADGRTQFYGILREWNETNIHFAEAWEGESAPWWYNERASLSVLAGAVWRLGGVVFEEFSDEKTTRHHRGNLRKSYQGRCDIYFMMGATEFVAEAKWGWSGASQKGGDPNPHISQLLDAAVEAADRVAKNRQCRLAIAFVTPYFKPRFKHHDTEMINSWIQKTGTLANCAAMAWVFPKECRRLSGSDGNYYPGAAIFIREVKRRSNKR